MRARTRNSTKFSRQILLLGFVLFFLSLLTACISYYLSDTYYRKEIDASNTALLKQSIDQVDSQLRTLDHASLIFMLNNPSLMQFMSSEYMDIPTGRRFEITRTLRGDLHDIKGAHPSVHTIYLLSNRNNNALMESGLYTMDVFLRMVNVPITHERDRNVSFMRCVYTPLSTFPDLQGANAVNTIVMLRSYPADIQSVSYGMMATFIQETTIFNILRQAMVYDDASISIIARDTVIATIANGNMDADGIDDTAKQVLAARGDKAAVYDDGEQRVYLEYSSYTNWWYMLKTPKGTGTSITRTVRDLFFHILCAYMVLVFCVVYQSNRRAYGRLDKLARMLRKYTLDNGTRKKDDLLTAVAYITETNTSLEGEVHRYKPMATQMMVSNLLHPGRISDYDAHLDELERYGVPFNRNGYAVVMIQAGDLAGLSDAFEGMEDAGMRVAALQIDEHQTAGIVSFRAAEQEVNEELLMRFLDNLTDSLKDACIGVGRFYPDGIGIPASYREAIEALKYKIFFQDRSILYIDDIRVDIQNIDAGLDKSIQAIVSALKSGNAQSMLASIERCIQEIAAKKTSISMFQMMISHLIIQGVQAASDMGVDLNSLGRTELHDFNQALQEIDSIDSIIAYTQEMYLLLGRNIVMKKNNRSIALLGARAIQFVNERYSDSELSMLHLAELLGVSDSYVRRVFREYVSCTFQEYVTQVRMERAKSLLMDAIPISTVAQMVGYNSDNSFIRAFRNRYGVSPGSWRQNKGSAVIGDK